eukprot:5283351-Pyramimonas_sp.AAC.2
MLGASVARRPSASLWLSPSPTLSQIRSLPISSSQSRLPSPALTLSCHLPISPSHAPILPAPREATPTSGKRRYRAKGPPVLTGEKAPAAPAAASAAELPAGEAEPPAAAAEAASPERKVRPKRARAEPRGPTPFGAAWFWEF